jgi:hypothetical protein
MSDFVQDWLQFEALRATMASDENTLAKVLMSMKEQELRDFLRTLDHLRKQVNEQLRLKEL